MHPSAVLPQSKKGLCQQCVLLYQHDCKICQKKYKSAGKLEQQDRPWKLHHTRSSLVHPEGILLLSDPLPVCSGVVPWHRCCQLNSIDCYIGDGAFLPCPLSLSVPHLRWLSCKYKFNEVATVLSGEIHLSVSLNESYQLYHVVLGWVIRSRDCIRDLWITKHEQSLPEWKGSGCLVKVPIDSQPSTYCLEKVQSTTLLWYTHS